MPIKRELPPRVIEAPDVKLGRMDPNYGKVLVRLLAAHALAEKLTADGYQRALAETRDPELAEALQKNLSEERKHAVLIYRALAEIGVNEVTATRMMIAAK